MKISLGAALLAAVALAASACGSSHPTSNPPTSGSTVSSSRLILGGTVRCTATLATAVQAGAELGISFAFDNVSKRTVKVQLAYGGMWVVVRSPDGTTYDTRIPLENEFGPFHRPTPLAPGATKTVPLQSLRVRWEGPLRITPGCGLSPLRPVRIPVTSPGPPTSATAAVNGVVAATGHLLDNCRPRTSGVSVVGRIDAPRDSAPPMRARCSIKLRHERGFDVAQVLVLTPPDSQGVRISQPYEALTGFKGDLHTNAEAVAWEFVVTRDGATSVDSTTVDSAKSGSGRMAPDWQWTSSGWTGRPGGSRCGHTGGGGGGYPGPLVEFVSACR